MAMINDISTIYDIINGLMDTPVSELSTLNGIIFGLVVGVSIIAIMLGFPVLAEKSADVICAATQKASKRIITAFEKII